MGKSRLPVACGRVGPPFSPGPQSVGNARFILLLIFCAGLYLGAADGATLTVTNANDSGPGTLREAISRANTNSGLDTIAFNLPNDELLPIIIPASALPEITNAVIIDGTTQPGYAGTPIVEINGMTAGPAGGLDCLLVSTHGSGTTIKGLAIYNWWGAGIALVGGGNNIVAGNFLGTDVISGAGVGNNVGVVIVGSTNNVIGGATPDGGNVISGNLYDGVEILNYDGFPTRFNRVQGNYIGVSRALNVLGNGWNGILISAETGSTTYASNNIIGGTAPGSANIIAGNGENGIEIYGGNDNLVQGNFIGTDGSLARGNTWHGVSIGGALQPDGSFIPAIGNMVGGTDIAERNIISGNGLNGVQVVTGSYSNVIQGNLIGVRSDGTSPLGNGRHGVAIADSANNLVGGSVSGAGNVISGNSSNGVFIGTGFLDAGSVSNRVQGNHIGISGAGNGAHGVFIGNSRSVQNWIGGFDAAERNWIAFNGANLARRGHGVVVESGEGNPILGNLIWDNAGRGIDHGNDSFTLNEDEVARSDGLQNYPVVTSVAFPPGRKVITWMLRGAENQSYRLEFFGNSAPDDSGFGEGETWLGSAVVTGDTNSLAIYKTNFPDSVQFISATATDLTNLNTSEFSIVDTDGDALADAWESHGIYFNEDNNGPPDLVLDGANPLHKDIFIEVDAMEGRVPVFENLNRINAGLTGGRDGFANAPNELVHNPDGANGITVHIEMDDEELPFEPWPNDDMDHFVALKAEYFGTLTQRLSENRTNILAAKKLAYHYCIFADTAVATNCGDFTKGLSDVEGEPGNDFWIALGTNTVSSTSPEVPGAFMHELGHNLSLTHGGWQPDEAGKNFKPNYHSIMNYRWCDPNYISTPGYRLDYSREAYGDLDESNLVESAGISGVPPEYANYTVLISTYGPGNTRVFLECGKEGGPIDWNHNGSTNEIVSTDINYPGCPATREHMDVLLGSEDWSHLRFDFINTEQGRDLSPALNEGGDLPSSFFDQFDVVGTGVGVFGFAAPRYSVSETGTVAVITVLRTAETTGTVSVAYGTVSGTASDGEDYTAVSGVITFTNNENAKTFSLPILNDNVAELPETIELRLSNPAGGAILGFQTNCVVTIMDDDGKPIPTQATTYGAMFSYTIPADTFTNIAPGATFTYSASGLPPDITLDGATGVFSGVPTELGSNWVTVTATANSPGVPSGQTSFGLVVGKAPLVVTADDASRNYGDANPFFSGHYDGFVLGEDESVLGVAPMADASADASSPVGAYPITLTSGEADHYFLIYSNGTLTVLPAPLTVSINNAKRFYGETNPVFTGSIAGMVNNDNLTATFSADATPCDPPAAYPITPGIQDPDHRLGNYVVTTNAGYLLVVLAETETIKSFNLNFLPDRPSVFHPTALIEGSDGALYGVAAAGIGGLQGEVFRMNHDGSAYASLHSFTNLYNSAAELIECSDGLLYGTMHSPDALFKMSKDGSSFSVVSNFPSWLGIYDAPWVEGTNGALYGLGYYRSNSFGVIIRIERDGSGLVVLHDFVGSGPSGLMLGSDGMLYGGTDVFKIGQGGGGYQLLHTFPDYPLDGAFPSERPMEGADGALYGTTSYGGDNGLGTVYRMNKDGSGYAVLYSFTGGTNDGMWPGGILIQGDNGNLYGHSILDGSNNRDRIFSINTNGTGVAMLAMLRSDSGSFSQLLFKDNAGFLYGVSFVGGTGSGGNLFRVAQDGSGVSILHQFVPLYAGYTSDAEMPYAPPIEGSDGVLYGTCTAGGVSGEGAIYRINKDGSGFATLHSFSSAAGDGLSPESKLTAGSNGVFFGTTLGGGANGLGTIFRINRDGTDYHVLHNSSGIPDGYALLAELIEGSDGALYGTAVFGGSNNLGTIFKINQDGSGYTTLYNFTPYSYMHSPDDGSYPYAGLIEGSDGLLYGLTLVGGTNSGGTAFKIKKDGTSYTVLHDFGSTDVTDANPQYSLIEGSDGALYGATPGTYNGGKGAVFKMNKDGSGYAILRSLGATAADPLAVYGSLVQGTDGGLYASSSAGGLGYGTLFKINKDGSGYTLLSVFDAAAEAGGNGPLGLSLASDGRFYGVTVIGGSNNVGTLFRLQIPILPAPGLANPIPDQSGAYGVPFNYTFGPDVFLGTTLCQTLSYDASGLPPGIGFTPATRTFSGTPTNQGTFSVTLSATDIAVPALSTNDVFEIVVARAPLTVTANDTNRAYGESNPAFTGTLLGVLPGDNITATFAAIATPDSAPGAYPIIPTLEDPDTRLVNYLVTTNIGTLTVGGVSLEVSLSAGLPTFCWQTNAAAFVLEYTDDLTPPATWHEVISGITTNGPSICLTVTPETDSPSRFFRLRLP